MEPVVVADQCEVALLGSFDVRICPGPRVATHNLDEGQEMLGIPADPGTFVLFHVGTDVGVDEVKIFPPMSTAAQNDGPSHAIPVMAFSVTRNGVGCSSLSI